MELEQLKQHFNLKHLSSGFYVILETQSNQVTVPVEKIQSVEFGKFDGEDLYEIYDGQTYYYHDSDSLEYFFVL